MTTAAMLIGGFVGVALRLALNRPQHADRWRAPLITILGSFLLGALTGAALVGTGPQLALGVALSAALLTYCVCNEHTTTALRHGPDRRTLMRAALTAATGFIAATPGVALSVALIG